MSLVVELDGHRAPTVEPNGRLPTSGMAAQLRCYVPERTDAVYARLRHLGARREELVCRAGAQRQQLGALAECAWPAVLDAAVKPLDSTTWQAALQVVLDRVEGGDLAAVRRRVRWSRFQTAVRKTVVEVGGQRVCWRIARAVYDALDDDTGVPTQRHGALERIGLLVADWHHTNQARTAVAGSLLRQLHAVVTKREPWNPQTAAGHHTDREVMPPAA